MRTPASLRDRVVQLALLDDARVVFGASAHDWTLGPPATEQELLAWERAVGVTLPPEYREFVASVGAWGAGPYYGLLPLPRVARADEPADDLDPRRAMRDVDLCAPFVGDSEDPAVLGDARQLRGCVVLADHGCGYRSLLALVGPNRGRVFADARGLLEGIQIEASSFGDWYAEWLDRALAEWAREVLPDAARRGSADTPPEVDAALRSLRATFGRPAPPDSTHERLYSTCPLAWALARFHLAIYDARLDDAVRAIAAIRAAGSGDRAGEALLATALVFEMRGDRAAALATLDAGGGAPHLWFRTTARLHEDRARLLGALGRPHEKAEATLRRARHTRELYAWFDAAWALIEVADPRGAAEALIEAVTSGANIERDAADTRSGGALALDLAQPLIDALESDGAGAHAAALRAALATHADAPRTVRAG